MMRPSSEITFVTSNQKKAEQLSRHLGVLLQHQALDLPEIQSLSLEEVVKDKAARAYALLQSPVLVEDTSLTFQALGSLPGPLIKWFLESLGNVGLASLLDGYGERSATATVMFALFDGETMRIFDGEVAGTIAAEPRGEHGFGWDPIFIPDGHKETWGEMSMEKQDQTSMRRIALLKLADHLVGGAV